MAMPSTDPTVLVVGAGPTGLMLAAQLARHGIPCRIVDQAAHATTESRALALQARSLELLDGMGLVDQVLERGLVLRHGNLYTDPAQPPAVQIRLDDMDSPYNCAVDLPQAETERILTDYLRDFGVAVEWQVALTGFTQDDAQVHATLRHADGREERLDVAWLAGCDGAHSPTRHALGIPFAGKEYVEGFALADVRVAWSRPSDAWNLFLTERGLLAFFPLRGGHQRIIAQVPPVPEGQPPPAPTLDELLRLCHERGLTDVQLSDPVWLSGFRCHERKASRFRGGRAFLLGDAAHIHSPAGGQGMNTGMQDACNLAWKLALVARDQAPAALLDSYEAERIPVAESVLRMSDVMLRVGMVTNPVAVHLRAHLYRFLGQLDAVQHQVADRVGELLVNYRHSPIVAERRDGLPLRPWGGPHAGDRAPDVDGLQTQVGERRRLFDLLRGPSHTLLLFAGHEPAPPIWTRLEAVAQWVTQRYPRLIQPWWVLHGHATPAATVRDGTLLRDPDGALHERYAARDAALYLLRPDGYVGYRAQPLDLAPLQVYLGRLLR